MAESNGNSNAETNVDKKDILDKGDVSELTDLEKNIIRQIEYYFGDMNLPRDKFLQEQVKLEDGWISLDIMLKFKRLAQMSTDQEVIVNSLAKSTNNLMEISEDRKRIRRSPKIPLPIHNEERRKEIMSRSVYAKGFPLTGFTMDNALAFFSTFGSIDNIQLRNRKDIKTNQYLFKGSVYAVFKSIDDAKAFINLESVKHEDTELIKKWQSDHISEKRATRIEKQHPIKEEKKPETVVVTSETMTKGAVLHITGFSGDISRECIRKHFETLGATVLFVDFNKGDTEGWVRLDKEDAAKEIMTKIDNAKIDISGVELKVVALEGEVEAAYLAKSLEDMKKRREKNRSGGRGKGRRGGRGGGRGRGGDRSYKRKGSPSRDGASFPKK